MLNFLKRLRPKTKRSGDSEARSGTYLDKHGGLVISDANILRNLERDVNGDPRGSASTGSDDGRTQPYLDQYCGLVIPDAQVLQAFQRDMASYREYRNTVEATAGSGSIDR